MIPAITLGIEERRRRNVRKKGKEKRGEEVVIRRPTGNILKNFILFCNNEVSWRSKILFPDPGKKRKGFATLI